MICSFSSITSLNIDVCTSKVTGAFALRFAYKEYTISCLGDHHYYYFWPRPDFLPAPSKAGMVTCTSIVPAPLPAMVTMSCPTCTPASFILSKEVSHSSYFHIFHTFCTLFSELKEGGERGGQQSMIVGMRRGANCVKPVSNVSMGEGESKICTALRSRARASRIKKREVQKIKEEGEMFG